MMKMTKMMTFWTMTMMTMTIGEGGDLSLDYGAEAINSQNFWRTLKPLFQKTPPCPEFKNQNHSSNFGQIICASQTLLEIFLNANKQRSLG